MTTIRIVVWEWRDGSPHLEVPTVVLIDDDGEARTHLDTSRFETACGQQWFGRTSSSGITHSQAVNCQQCRRVFFDPTTTFEVETPKARVEVES